MRVLPEPCRADSGIDLRLRVRLVAIGVAAFAFLRTICFGITGAVTAAILLVRRRLVIGRIAATVRMSAFISCHTYSPFFPSQRTIPIPHISPV